MGSGIAVLVALLGVGVPVALHLNTRIDTVKTDLTSLGTKLDKVSEAVKVLTSQQTDQTQKLIHDLLAAAASPKNPAASAKAIEVASQLTAALRKEKRPASPEFFQTAIASIRENKAPELKSIALQTQRQLAEYRSALEPVQTIGSVFRCATTAEQGVHIQNMPRNTLLSMSKVTIDGCSQTLDGVNWDSAIFVNSRINYRGGPLILHNVIFINCTFDVEGTNSGADLLDYAALGQRELRIGQGRPA